MYNSGWKYLVISKPDRQLGPNTDQSATSYQTRQDPFADWDVQLHYRVVVPNTNGREANSVVTEPHTHRTPSHTSPNPNSYLA
ncbi:hypothetical protein M0802_003321 [Mischocyttarus mexicanus]|nr:hypothetical protein M0802_003321 [Mischocyttarus mexicanus]